MLKFITIFLNKKPTLDMVIEIRLLQIAVYVELAKQFFAIV